MTRLLFVACAMASTIAVSAAGAANPAAPGPFAANRADGPVSAGAGPAAAAPASLLDSDLTVAEIIDKNVVARGGLEAWRKIHSMMWIGQIMAPESAAGILSFMMQMERPNKTHFEINAQGTKTARIFDGVEGWQVRMGHGKPDFKPYSLDQLAFARDAQVIDGYLIDYRAKGISIDADGIGDIEGRKAYRLSVTLPSGSRERVWVDAQTFLEVKSEHAVRNAAGLIGWVPIYYKDYQTVEGLKIPFAVETASAEGRPGDKLVIQKVILNPRVDERAFVKPVPKHVPGMADAGANGSPRNHMMRQPRPAAAGSSNPEASGQAAVPAVSNPAGTNPPAAPAQ